MGIEEFSIEQLLDTLDDIVDIRSDGNCLYLLQKGVPQIVQEGEPQIVQEGVQERVSQESHKKKLSPNKI